MANVLPIDPIAKHQKGTDAPKESTVSVWAKIKVFVNVFLSMRQASKIMKGLNEAEQIRAGRKKGKSYDEFLKEI